MAKSFILNGQDSATNAETLSYEDIARLVLVEHPSVTYKICGTNVGGILHPGDRVAVADGLVINAYQCSNG